MMLSPRAARLLSMLCKSPTMLNIDTLTSDPALGELLYYRLIDTRYFGNTVAISLTDAGARTAGKHHLRN